MSASRMLIFFFINFSVLIKSLSTPPYPTPHHIHYALFALFKRFLHQSSPLIWYSDEVTVIVSINTMTRSQHARRIIRVTKSHPEFYSLYKLKPLGHKPVGNDGGRSLVQTFSQQKKQHGYKHTICWLESSCIMYKGTIMGLIVHMQCNQEQ